MSFIPDWTSLRRHEVPDWYHDAKFGIFIHWGLYSIPAFAITSREDYKDILKDAGWKMQFSYNPYAEWYLNSLRIGNNPTQKYHEKTYGTDFKYDDFVPIFNEEIKKWDPREMVEVFLKAGAKYVVLVTKHHDGFTLWPSKYKNPKKENFSTSRDIVGELTEAVKAEELKMGVYYSGALDWAFQKKPVISFSSMVKNAPLDSEYGSYVDHHYFELIDKYAPSILWNDIGYPNAGNEKKVIAHFYNRTPEGVINDRWVKFRRWMNWLLKFPPISALINWIAKRATGGDAHVPTPPQYDFLTPEYKIFKEISEDKWETTRGIGNSFGYNQMEPESNYLTLQELVHMFIDIVSKNGNLLLNVGPMADGTIPEIQKQLILNFGKWLTVNGEGLYGTRPWVRAEGQTIDAIEVRFTQKENLLFAFILSKPIGDQITIKSLEIVDNAEINLLGRDASLKWQKSDGNLTITLPDIPKDTPAYAFRISPKPEA